MAAPGVWGALGGRSGGMRGGESWGKVGGQALWRYSELTAPAGTQEGVVDFNWAFDANGLQ